MYTPALYNIWAIYQDQHFPWCLWDLDSTPVYRILRDPYQKHMKEVFMFMKLMDIVSIVADKGTNLLAAD